MQNIDIVKENTITFLDNIGIEYNFDNITCEEENIFNIKITTDKPNLLIGQYGKNLIAINHILTKIIGTLLESRIILHLEINDYLEQKDKKLFNFIKSKIEYLDSIGDKIELPFFNGFERKKIHMFIQNEFTGIETESVGEGKNRKLFLIKTGNTENSKTTVTKKTETKKDSSLDIDLDGVEI